MCLCKAFKKECVNGSPTSGLRKVFKKKSLNESPTCVFVKCFKKQSVNESLTCVFVKRFHLTSLIAKRPALPNISFFQIIRCFCFDLIGTITVVTDGLIC